jgi:hypothetical protein
MKNVEHIDTLSFKEGNTSIYHCLREPPMLTVCIGAKCSDGPVLIADRKLTDTYGGQPQFRRKIFGDIEHVLTAYAGSVLAAKPIRIHPIFMSIIFHHYKQLMKIKEELEKWGCEVKYRSTTFAMQIERKFSFSRYNHR